MYFDNIHICPHCGFYIEHTSTFCNDVILTDNGCYKIRCHYCKEPLVEYPLSVDVIEHIENGIYSNDSSDYRDKASSLFKYYILEKYIAPFYKIDRTCEGFRQFYYKYYNEDGSPRFSYKTIITEGSKLFEKYKDYERPAGYLQAHSLTYSGISNNTTTKNDAPKCPICNSTNLTKISTTSKALKIGLFGLFGAGDVGKTYKCNNCGSKF